MLVGIIQFALLIIVVGAIVGTYGYFWRGATIQVSMVKGILFGVSSSEMEVETKQEEEPMVPIEVIQFSVLCIIFTVLWRRI